MKYKLINSVTKIETICDKVTIDGFDYYVSGNYKDGDYVILPLSNTFVKCVNGTTFIEGTQKVIATNNPNIDVPKVVDEVEQLALSYEMSFTDDDGTTKVDFKAGYNKSQETHPFSEEDMIEFAEWCKNLQKDNKEIRRSNPSITTKELLQIWKEQKPKVLFY